MVYNATYSGLNEVLWDPDFASPMLRFTLRATYKGTYMLDGDIGYMFLNFVLSKEVRPYCGVKISNVIM